MHGTLKLGLFLKHYPPQMDMFEFFGFLLVGCVKKDCKFFALLLQYMLVDCEWRGLFFPLWTLGYPSLYVHVASCPTYPYVGLVCKVGNSMAWPFSPLLEYISNVKELNKMWSMLLYF